MQKRWIIAIYACALSGCSILLDPEVCDSNDDCNGGVCKDGICIGGNEKPKEDAADSGKPMDAAPLQEDATELDAEFDAEFDAEVAIDCSLEGQNLVGEAQVKVTAAATADEDEDVEFTALLNDDSVGLSEGQASVEIPLQEGTNWISLVVTSDLGGRCEKKLRVDCDLTAPELSLDAPPIAVPGEKHKLSGRCTDAYGVEHLAINGNAVNVAWSATGEFEAEVDLNEGQNSFKVQCFDVVGHASEIQNCSVLRDSVPPVVELSSPASGAELDVEKTVLQGRVTSGTSPEANMPVVLTSTSDGRLVAQSRTRSNASGEFSGELALEVGVNELEACAIDEAGNKGCKSVQVTRPSKSACIQSVEFTNATRLDDVWMFSATPAELSGRLCDSVTGVLAELAYKDGGFAPIRVSIKADHSFEASVPFDQSGAYTLRITAESEEGQVTEGLALLFDNTAPTVSLSQPTTQRCITDESVRICGEAHDAESGIASVTVNGSAVTLDGTENFCISSPLLEGEQTITLEAVNAVGLSSKVERVVGIDRTPPEIALRCVYPDCYLDEKTDEEGNVIESHRYYKPNCDAGANCPIHVEGTVNAGICSLTQFSLNGTSIPSALSTGQFALDLAMEEGNRELKFKATDSANQLRELTEPIVVDGTPPELKCEQTSLEVPVGTTAVTLTCRVGDTSENQIPAVVSGPEFATCAEAAEYSDSDHLYWRECTVIVNVERILAPTVGASVTAGVSARDLAGNTKDVELQVTRVAAEENGGEGNP